MAGYTTIDRIRIELETERRPRVALAGEAGDVELGIVADGTGLDLSGA
jgi:hypothetical protein